MDAHQWTRRRFQLPPIRDEPVGNWLPPARFGPVIVNPKAINRITDLDARADIELSWPHETARRHDFEFQKAEAGIRARRCAN
jgi:hypothetical protein